MIEAELHFFEGRIEVWIGDSEHKEFPSGKKVFEMEGIEAAELVVREDAKTKHWKLLVHNEQFGIVLVDQKDRERLEQITEDFWDKDYKLGMLLR